MRIMMFTNTYTPHVGGVARSVDAFAREYRTLGHRCLVVAPEFDNLPDSEEFVIRVPAVQNFNGSDFSMPMPVPVFLSPQIDEFQPEIIHTHHPFLLGDTALRVAAIANAPLVFTHHTLYEKYTHYVPGDSPAMQRFVTELVNGFCGLCDAIIAPSESVQAMLRAAGVKTPIEINPTGVDVDHFAKGDGAAYRRRHQIPERAFVVGHLGRLAPEKNLEFLARAVAEYLASDDQAWFLVAGSGPSEETVKSVCHERGVADRLCMPGVVGGQDLVNAYHAMDVFAFASQSETQGMVLTEAMAAGVPVVAVDASGVRDVVVDRQNGRLIPTENLAVFVEGIRSLRRLSPADRDVLAQFLAATAERFSIRATAERSLEIYQSLVGTHPAGRTRDATAWESAMRLIGKQWELLGVHAKAIGEAIAGSGGTAAGSPAEHGA